MKTTRNVTSTAVVIGWCCGVRHRQVIPYCSLPIAQLRFQRVRSLKLPSLNMEKDSEQWFQVRQFHFIMWVMVKRDCLQMID